MTEHLHPWITGGFSNEQEWRDNLWYLEAACGVPFYSKYGYYSHEALIDAKTGTPEDCPMPQYDVDGDTGPPFQADDEDDDAPTL